MPTTSTSPVSQPILANGNNASSMVVAKHPGEAMYLAALIFSRLSSGSPYTKSLRCCGLGWSPP